jgi:hypothetical protein
MPLRKSLRDAPLGKSFLDLGNHDRFKVLKTSDDLNHNGYALSNDDGDGMTASSTRQSLNSLSWGLTADCTYMKKQIRCGSDFRARLFVRVDGYETQAHDSISERPFPFRTDAYPIWAPLWWMRIGTSQSVGQGRMARDRGGSLHSAVGGPTTQ